MKVCSVKASRMQGQEDSLVNACELLLNNLQYQAEVVDDPAKLKQFVVMLQVRYLMTSVLKSCTDSVC